LEATYYGQADFVGHSEIAKGLAQHRKSRAAGTPYALQKQPRGISQKSESLCSQLQKENRMISPSSHPINCTIEHIAPQY
jgi:hypothetical protein